MAHFEFNMIYWGGRSGSCPIGQIGMSARRSRSERRKGDQPKWSRALPSPSLRLATTARHFRRNSATCQIRPSRGIPMNEMPSVIGYLNRLSFSPGDPFSVHASGSGDVNVDLVRLGRGRVPGRDMSGVVESVAWADAGSIAVKPQVSCTGAFLLGEPAGFFDAREGFALGAGVYPTNSARPDKQVILELSDESHTMRVYLVRGVVSAELEIGGALVAAIDSVCPIRDRTWAQVWISLTPNNMRLTVLASNALYSGDGFGECALPSVSVAFDQPRLVVAASSARDVTDGRGWARGRAQDHFDGKISAPFVRRGSDSPSLGRRPTLLERLRDIGRSGGALWDLAPQPTGDSRHRVPLVAGEGSAATLVNLPHQGVTGPDWDCRSVSFRECPEQFSAAYFNFQSIIDVGWDAAVESIVPEHLPSGVYAIRLTSNDGTADVIPFFVRRARGAKKARSVFVASTLTYLAYGNEDLISFFEATGTRLSGPGVLDRARDLHTGRSVDIGLSTYDKYTDGVGVHYSSALRPLLNMRPDIEYWGYSSGGGARGFGADLYLLEWLETHDYPFDVITDLELHQEGVAALDGYDLVLTGSHPEYHTARSLDAFEQYRDRSGNLLYLGGNGFYWVTGLIDSDAPCIEIRRGYTGMRMWTSEPGEADLVSGWETGGLWRHRGRPPQRLVGVGMAAAGGDSRPFDLAHGEIRTTHSWFYEGLPETFGLDGFARGGASGDEIDRVDVLLGTPPEAMVLASSSNHPLDAQRTVEELEYTFHGGSSGPNDPEIHADIVYFETPRGGSVFSVGSIAFLASLPVDAGSSRCLRNVMEHMLERSA
ncbi:N,N-dimethylformamidase beta subunit family domain-containing protein [Rhodococcus sp. NPDC060176]|uniref:N,N-dimethylformamidase beta subunit family domain-containing protein n=1 Tax=Rhodococcus sp. NPDC060176 TaxID=3347062 RepID=UPI00364E1883